MAAWRTPRSSILTHRVGQALEACHFALEFIRLMVSANLHGDYFSLLSITRFHRRCYCLWAARGESKDCVGLVSQRHWNVTGKNFHLWTL